MRMPAAANSSSAVTGASACTWVSAVYWGLVFTGQFNFSGESDVLVQ